ncbi:MAG: GGDEF domain-containing protein [Mycobacterium sp.]|nr:GGDEF domain-containing protein [Mycobacterium sp.]
MICANTDSLTGLLNRRGLEHRLEAHDGLQLDGERSVALMVVDLDQFKQVNDTYGHAVGDRVLRRTARRLRATTGSRPCVARTGGEGIHDCATGRRDRGAPDCRRDPRVRPRSGGRGAGDGQRWRGDDRQRPMVGRCRIGARVRTCCTMFCSTPTRPCTKSKRKGGNRTTVYVGE